MSLSFIAYAGTVILVPCMALNIEALGICKMVEFSTVNIKVCVQFILYLLSCLYNFNCQGYQPTLSNQNVSNLNDR
jgi:hypothetical protein